MEICWHSCPHCGGDWWHEVPNSSPLDKFFAACERCAHRVKQRPALPVIEDADSEPQDAARDAQLIAVLSDTWEREPFESEESEFANICLVRAAPKVRED